MAGFIPRTANVILSWRYRGFSSRLLVNYTSDFISSYNAASPGRNLHRFEATRVNLGFGYEIRPSLSLTCDVSNVFNEPQVLYRGIPEQLQRWTHTGTTISLGVSGRF